MSILVFLLLCLVPAACFELIARGVGRWTRYADSRPARPVVRDEQAERARYSRDLRRLAADYDRVMTGDQPAKAARLRAVELAYDDTLRLACRTFELDAPVPLDAFSRVQVEADLVAHGLTW